MLTVLVQGNSIREGGVQALAEALQQNGSLTDLDIYVRLQQLRQATKTLTLLLQNNGIGDCGAGAMAEALQQNGTLQHLNLSVRKRRRVSVLLQGE